jgi:K+-sensing histidine kinase KdpD
MKPREAADATDEMEELRLTDPGQNSNSVAPQSGERGSGVFLVGQNPAYLRLAQADPDKLYPPGGTFSTFADLNTIPPRSSYPPSYDGAPVSIKITLAPPVGNETEEAEEGMFDRLAMEIHNLRNALGVVTNNAEIVRDELDLESVGKREKITCLEDIMAAVKKAISITNVINGAIAGRKNKLTVQRKLVDVEDFMDDIIQTYRAKTNVRVINGYGIRLASMDPYHMENVLNNLISNALKYAPEGKIFVTCFMENGNNDLVFSVTDQGKGIGENPEQLFDLYKRGDNEKMQQGFGLGLYYCRLVCEKHGGTITAENNSKRGATFKITIPQGHKTPELK